MSTKQYFVNFIFLFIMIKYSEAQKKSYLDYNSTRLIKRQTKGITTKYNSLRN